MEEHNNSLTRRTFLKSGSAAATFIAVFPVWRFLYPVILKFDFCTTTDRNLPNESLERLLETAHKYGAELGGTQVQYLTKADSLGFEKAKFINRQNQRNKGGA